MNEQTKEIAIQYQQLQQQLQTILIQKESSRIQLFEMDRAVKELEKPVEEVYKSTGLLLIKTNPADLKKELEEQKSTLEVRIKSFEKQEERIKDKLKDLHEKLTKNARSPDSETDAAE